MSAIITLTTDFGLSDGYVAAMKAVILGINPAATMVDISHNIRPQDIAHGAFVLGTVWKSFPRGTVHLAVVDPGVGTERRAIALSTPFADFVAPDNGVLSYVLQPAGAGEEQAVLGPGMKAVALTNPRYWRRPVSPTFHGRDIFAPAAGHLSLGRPLRELGEAVTSLALLPLSHPRRTAPGVLVGCVVHIDHFGNLVTNLRQEDLPAGPLAVDIGAHRIQGLSRTYGEASGLLALIGSSGYLEISLKNGSASALLNAGIGDEVVVH
ncbi:MAG: SAM-dependent chlorinase/fluorinase [Chloroflexi bacterium]|nr:SAM-dependent chlorinase/fluorinase [Chloroflexota bacterium]